MPIANFVQSDGTARRVEGEAGANLLDLAQNHGVDGIIGECGGSLSCATCHVYVDEAWVDCLEPISADEDAMLDGTYCDREANSRLGCQIRLSPALDGIVVRIPERQT